MGNSTSTESTDTGFTTKSVVRKQTITLFRRYVKESFSNVELITISHALFGKIVELNTQIPYDELLDKLGLGYMKDKQMGKLFNRFLTKCTNWPLISDRMESDFFTLNDILVLVFILNKNGFEKLGLHDPLFNIEFYFIAFLSAESVDALSEEIDVIFNQNNEIQWHLLPIVKSFDYSQLEELNESDIEQVLQILLPLSVFMIDRSSFSLNYKVQVKSLLQTFNLTGASTMTFQNVIHAVHTFTPKLFASLKNIFSDVLYRREATTEVEGNESKISSTIGSFSHKIMSLQLLSQLSTVTDILDISSTLKSKPLYQGSSNGFSINSIQSHTINYNAKTMLLISGRTKKRTDIESTFYTKFPAFHPVLNSAAQLKDNQRFQIVVFIPTPWRITNTKTFGNEELKVVMLSPYQIELNCLNSVKQDYCYFSNIGLGIGFGSQTPQKSKDSKKHSSTFRLGGVSLTIDTSLEVGNFRVEDPSKHSSTLTLASNASTSSTHTPHIYNDLWFKITEVEICGMGDQTSVEEQKRALAWEEREAERRRALGNKDYMEGRALLELAGIIGGNTSGGSV